jgi:hypothetical protein
VKELTIAGMQRYAAIPLPNLPPRLALIRRPILPLIGCPFVPSQPKMFAEYTARPKGAKGPIPALNGNFHGLTFLSRALPVRLFEILVVIPVGGSLIARIFIKQIKIHNKTQ